MNSGSEWKWWLLDVFAQSKDDVEMWVDAPGRSLSSSLKPSLNDPNGNVPKHHGRKNPFSLWRSDTECATDFPAGQAARLPGTALSVKWLGCLAAGFRWPSPASCILCACQALSRSC